ncbi:unnamed protein product [Soboliphyme baturini]|uniref:Transmembrane protein n=1 Tax=Soboliphyme baturini TaxID=241478 RepID=A0A183IR18_9BILA|nr:unnamed protein product [Soboliphyme baturini]
MIVERPGVCTRRGCSCSLSANVNTVWPFRSVSACCLGVVDIATVVVCVRIFKKWCYKISCKHKAGRLRWTNHHYYNHHWYVVVGISFSTVVACIRLCRLVVLVIVSNCPSPFGHRSRSITSPVVVTRWHCPSIRLSLDPLPPSPFWCSSISNRFSAISHMTNGRSSDAARLFFREAY